MNLKDGATFEKRRLTVEHSIFLAKVIGLYLLIVPAAALLKRKQFAELANEFVTNLALVFLSGLVSLILGLRLLSAIMSGLPTGERS